MKGQGKLRPVVKGLQVQVRGCSGRDQSPGHGRGKGEVDRRHLHAGRNVKRVVEGLGVEAEGRTRNGGNFQALT